MLKINQKKFHNIINYKKYDVTLDSKIIPIDTNYILEIKHGKNYFYTLDKNNKKALEIYNIHSNIIKEILDNIDLNKVAMAFRKKYSYLDFFYPHIDNYNFIRLDITSFFHSIKREDIVKTFETYFTDEYLDKNEKQTLVDSFTDLITIKIDEKFKNTKYKDKVILPMGFKTSPAVSNIIFRKLDILIQKFCMFNNIIYTRYADDLLFSSNENIKYIHSDNFIKEIAIFLSTMGFKVNENKTIKASHTLSLNGYIIQSSGNENPKPELRISQKKTKIIYKIIYLYLEKKKSPEKIINELFKYDKIKIHYEDQLLNKVSGYRAYLLSLVKFNKTYECMSQERESSYLELVTQLDSIINKLIANMSK